MGYALHAFDDAVRFSATCETVLDVYMGHYAVVTPDSPIDALTTHSTNICAGWALVEDATEDPTIALMHVFSKLDFYRHGEDAVRAHAARAWDTFQSALPAATHFRAVAFGGRRFDDDPSPAIDPAHVATYFETSDRLGKILRSDEYQKAHNEAMLPPFDGTNAYDRDAHLAALDRRAMRAMTESELKILAQPHIDAASLAMAWSVSWWIGDELHKRARQSGIVDIVADYRFQDAPHDAAVLRNGGHVTVSRYEDYATRKIKGTRLRGNKGEKLFLSPFVLS